MTNQGCTCWACINTDNIALLCRPVDNDLRLQRAQIAPACSMHLQRYALTAYRRLPPPPKSPTGPPFAPAWDCAAATAAHLPRWAIRRHADRFRQTVTTLEFVGSGRATSALAVCQLLNQQRPPGHQTTLPRCSSWPDIRSALALSDEGAEPAASGHTGVTLAPGCRRRRRTWRAPNAAGFTSLVGATDWRTPDDGPAVRHYADLPGAELRRHRLLLHHRPRARPGWS